MPSPDAAVTAVGRVRRTSITPIPLDDAPVSLLERCGLPTADRGAASAELAATTQFAGLRPVSATFLARRALDCAGQPDTDDRR